MLDIHLLRQQFDVLKERIATKHFACDLERIRALDQERLQRLKAFEAARAQQQAANQTIAALDKNSSEFKNAIQNLKTLAAATKSLEAAYQQSENAFKEAWLSVPNIPDASVPIGASEKDNRVLYEWHPENENFSHSCPHYELPNFNDGIDFQRGTKVMGAGFPFYTNDIARLVRALIQFFLEAAHNDGYEELLPPLLVNGTSATATGQLPDKEGMMYATHEGAYLIPTAEVPVTNFFRDEIFDEAELPKKCCAYSACFRREAGSWGKEVRGLNRLHQFDKVERVLWVHPSHSFAALETLRSEAENLLKALEIPYRVLEICTGDIGFPHAKQYDLEVWAAGQKRWLEVSSCSCFTDFQARRANIRYRTAQQTLSFVHTLNGSALAIPRVLAAILENNHQGDGRIRVPVPLQPTVRNQTLTLKKLDL